MKVIVTKLGSDTEGGRGRVDFYRYGEIIHSEAFEGKISSEYVRVVNVACRCRGVFVPLVGEFAGRIEA